MEPENNYDGRMPVNIILGKFQPLSKSHIEAANHIYRETGYQTVLCIVANKRPTAANPFSSDDMVYVYGNLLETGKFPSIRGFVTVKSANIVQFIDSIRQSGMEPVIWTTMDEKKHAEYSRIVKNYGKEVGLTPDFKVVNYTPDADHTERMARFAISSNNYDEFRKATPFNTFNYSECRKLFDKLCVKDAEALNNFKF